MLTCSQAPDRPGKGRSRFLKAERVKVVAGNCHGSEGG